ncbi:glycosyltransferase [Agromyces sp. NPDC058110]|uniref:glycosyltransferase n=1 Tax=Agromyces sp. NPDC058110 TaxID=3346345 RepID=UPI0036DF0B4C
MRNIRRVLVFPAWEDNPFLNLLSLAPRAAGCDVRGATTFASLLAAAEQLRAGDVLHVHWTTPIVQAAPTEAAAWRAVDEVRALLDRLRRRGAKMLWTVHNRLPHELEHREPEIALHRLLADRADAVHVMAPDTPELLADVCAIDPTRTLRIPHPSYAGVYGPPTPAAEARSALGVAPDEPTVLFLGQMRPYKGIELLLAAIEHLDRSGRDLPVLLLAGSADRVQREAILAALPRRARTIARFEFIPDREVGGWFGAADVAVFPYRAILNSGSVHLAATYGVPVLLPDEPHLVRQFGEHEWVRFADVSDPSLFASAITRSLARPVGEPGRLDCRRFVRERSPWRISQAYARALEGVVAGARVDGLGLAVPGGGDARQDLSAPAGRSRQAVGAHPAA